MSQVSLRPIETADSERTFGWVTHSWYMNEFAGRSIPTHESHRAFFSKAVGGGRFCAIELDGVHVGNLGVKDFAPGIGDLWYYVGEESCRGKGVASAAVGEAIRWARDGLGLSRLVARVLETNIGSRAVLERNGFSLADEGFGMRDGVAMLRYELDLTDG